MKTKMKMIVTILVFVILFVGCGKLFRYILTDDINSYTRITFHEMYKQDNIDVLFVGSSHCYRSFIPEILDKELRLNTFNAGTSSQALDGSLMVIKEAVRYNNISHVYLEMYFNMAFGIYKNRSQMTETYIISDYLKPSLDKYTYLLKASSEEHYPNSFIVARRNWEKLLDLDYMKDIIIEKNSEVYKSYEYISVPLATGNTEWYVGKGYVANDGIVKDWDYFSKSEGENIDFDHVSEDWLNSLSNIIDFCDKRNIDLTLVTAPVSNFEISALESYDEYVTLINDIIKGTDVDFYDFNLCREVYFPNTSSLFYDYQHMNYDGAEIFSHCFAKLVNGEVSPQEMFYSSYSEKLENLEPTVFGVNYYDDTADDGVILRNCKIVSSGHEGIEYEISIIPDEGETYMVQGYSDEECFVISPDEKGICMIKYRMRNDIEREHEVRLTLP